MSTSKAPLAFFLPGLYEGGAERVFLNLAKAIADRGYPVDLVLARAEGPYLPQLPRCVRLVDLQSSRVLGSVSALARYLRREHPVAMLSAMFANIVAIWARHLDGCRERLVITEHNTLSSVVRNKVDLRWKFYPRLAGWFYPWADEIIAVSHGIADDLAHATGISRERIRVIYNPVVTPELLEKSREPLDHEWFRPDAAPVIVSVGRLTSQKGFDTLIRAFSMVRQQRKARLIILGEGELRSALEALIYELGLDEDVQLPGFVQNPYPYIARGSVFALASRWEGLPTVIIEALYLGTRIVTTACPGGTREILRDGQYGRLVPVDAPAALADAIQASLASGAPAVPAESLRVYDAACVVDRYVELLLGA